MNKVVLNKDISIQDNLVVITEEIETKLDKRQLERKLQDLQMRKMSLQEQNTRLVSEYDQLILEETELNDLISQLNDNDGIKEI